MNELFNSKGKKKHFKRKINLRKKKKKKKIKNKPAKSHEEKHEA